jgi:hypothetical protein
VRAQANVDRTDFRRRQIVGNLFAGAAISSSPAMPISRFPAMEASIVDLLGISHGRYLVGKVANKQPKGEGL